jgi:hypothetical protein
MTGPDSASAAGELEAQEPTAADVGKPDLPSPHAAARIAALLADHLAWSAFWDKRYQVWRVAENDPESGLYAESHNADAVIKYMAAIS